MIIIARAKLKDAQQIRALEQEIWDDPHITSPYEAATFVQFGYAFIAKENAEVIGAIVAIKTADDSIRVIDWLVKENYRGKGIGEKLYRRLFKAVGNTALITFVDQDAIASLNGHRKLGFRIIQKIKDPFGMGENSRVYLMKKL